jgi:hypothetical protein
MSGLLIHIGYHKTGSTWLQRFVFQSRDLGFTRLLGDLKGKFVATHDLRFDADATRAAIRPKLELALAEGLVPVVSEEHFSGDLNQRMNDSVRIADRLAAVFPDARVLIVIREQRAMILSTYRQHVMNGGLLSLEAFVAGGVWWHAFPFELRQYAYDQLIAHYHTRFGADNVLVLPYELLRRDGRDFVSRILDFAGAEPRNPGALDALPFATALNVGQPAAGLAVRHYVNRHLRLDCTPWGRFRHRTLAGRVLLAAAWRAGTLAPAVLNRRLDQRMRDVIASAVGRSYRKSNARTSKLIGIDLAEFGYDVPGPRPAN